MRAYHNQVQLKTKKEKLHVSFVEVGRKIRTMIRQYKFFITQVSETWIGLYKKANDDVLHWSDGSILDYQHWKNGQIVYPNKKSDVCMSQVFSSTMDGRWIATTNCTTALPFTCKIVKEKKVI